MKLQKILAIAMILCMALVVPASAADFPNRTVRILIPFSAGGATDLMSRIMAPAIASDLGVDVIVENRPGAQGAIAITELLAAPADGHTLILASICSVAINPNLSDVGYSRADLIPIVQAAELPTNIFVRADGPFEDFEDMVRQASENFGRLTYATAGTGGSHHIVAEVLQYNMGMQGLLTNVPFNSGTEAITAVLGGHVDMAFANASYGERFVNQSGEMRILGTSLSRGCPVVPATPTFKTLGYDVTVANWWGFFARTGTPEEVINRVALAVENALSDPEIIESMTNVGIPPYFINRAEFTAKYNDHYEYLEELLPNIF